MAPGDSRRVVDLYKAGKTPDEIAVEIGVSVEMVQSLLRARQRLLANPHVGVAREILREMADRESLAPTPPAATEEGTTDE